MSAARSDATPRIEFRIEARAVDFDRHRLEAVLAKILVDHGEARGVLSVAVVDDATIHAINREFLSHDEPSDVISFRLEDAGAEIDEDDVFAEVLVSAETALREAKARGRRAEDELALYAIHGTLHIVGYDDLDPAAKRIMRARERRYSRAFESCA